MSCHPVVRLFYFVCLISLTMFTLNPLIRLLSLIGAGLTYCLSQTREKWTQLGRVAFMLVTVSALANFLFTHQGATILWQSDLYLFSRWFRLALTAEAFFYGLSVGVVLTSLLLWFQSLERLVPTEDLIYLVARPLPKTALVLNLILTFIPSYLSRLAVLQETQQSLGATTAKDWRTRLHYNQALFVALFSWSLRDGLVTADSMNARGYGLGPRSQSVRHAFRLSDAGLLLVISGLVSLMLQLSQRGVYAFYYYPHLRLLETSPTAYLSYLPVGCFFLLPTLIMGMEALSWRYYQSKI